MHAFPLAVPYFPDAGPVHPGYLTFPGWPLAGE